MLKSLSVKGFKSLVDTGPIEFAPVTVLFGPNGAGKSNILDALEVLARIAPENLAVTPAPPEQQQERQVAALERAIRGKVPEQFTFGDAGLRFLMQQDLVEIQISATLVSEQGAPWRHELGIAYRPRTGHLEIRNTPFVDDLSVEGKWTRSVEFAGWRSYYLDPRGAMRTDEWLGPTYDIGSFGGHLASYLRHYKHSPTWDAVQRTLSTVVPSVEGIDVRNTETGRLDLEIVQGGVAHSSRLASDGTLRVLGLICALTRPLSRLVAFEEPENGVHPRRIELIAQMLVSIGIEAPQPKQIIVTTHSPILCGAMIQHAREYPGQIALLRVTHDGRGTVVKPLDPKAPPFTDEELRRELSTVSDESVFGGLVLRGLLDD
jgi:energy-coupling factor transporter ATP-binding protein EcfA2